MLMKQWTEFFSIFYSDFESCLLQAYGHQFGTVTTDSDKGDVG